VAVQAVKAVQEVTLQSMGQAKVLQVFTEVRTGQEEPPSAAELITERERFLVPEAQVAEQALKAVQEETLQSMGQAKVLHDLMPAMTGQPTPPKRAEVTTERKRFLVPEAQVAEQALKADQRLTLQSMGQGWVLQTRISLVGQASPPWRAAMLTE
jgi:hypothetical protein